MQTGKRFLLAVMVAGIALGLRSAQAAANDLAGSRRPALVEAPLFDLRASDFKFSLADLMALLRDRQHEGWVLAAYPDPKTKRPLIGAGFSLDVEAVDHPQGDPLNPHPFLEPSSAQLWQAAGLRPERLQSILEQYDRDVQLLTARRYRRRIRTHALTPQITDAEAMRLLRISALQAIWNARAYCRGFDQLTASQQMALSQLVFQMGVNLEKFVDFLGVLNGNGTRTDALGPAAGQGVGQVAGLATRPASAQPGDLADEAPLEAAGHLDYWKTLQAKLIDSQWARLYTARASTVIAMLDPAYGSDPAAARQRIDAVLRPAPALRRGTSAGALHDASYHAAAQTRHTRSPGSTRSDSRGRNRAKSHPRTHKKLS